MNEIIKEIIAREWEMFQQVNSGTGVRASCQDDSPTFRAMRSGQFAAWDDAARMSYLVDLQNAQAAGRNLIAEKYIYMMSTTAPEEFAVLAADIPRPSDRTFDLAAEICTKLVAQTEELHRDYPKVSGAGRPLYAVSDVNGYTSVETYQFSELLTYSEGTLEKLLAHLNLLESEGISLAKNILQNSAQYYGYTSLEAAEAGQL
ncbi:MAG: DUF4125 family protein [Oscillospiraceae bacterium]|nr:DUF4125 family protein [Oscillospiraceae bacterium]